MVFNQKKVVSMEPRPKVLVVDDEELSQDFLRFFLSKKYEVYTSGSVNSFYNLIANVDFDVILMDVFLRDSKDGLQLTKEIKKTEKYKDIPIFIMTAHNTTRDKNEALNAGAHLFLTKPLDGKYILNLIDEVLKKKSTSIPS